jgi:hypothetical protein
VAACPTWRNALCPGGPEEIRRPVVWLIAVVLVLLGCAHAGIAAAETRFEVRSAYIEPAERVYELNATLNFDLAEGARAAVREGVPLTLHLEIVVKRQRNYWLDETVATLDQYYELAYRALSERYLVRNLNSGEQASYATLDAALDAMRVISRLPILDQALVSPSRRHEISVRGNLDVRTMPDALRFVLFWSDDWRQRSEWYTWSPQL